MREQLSLSDIQYGPFLPFLRKKDVTDIDYNGRELWIRDIHNIRHKVTDEKIRQRLNCLLYTSLVSDKGIIIFYTFPVNDKLCIFFF